MTPGSVQVIWAASVLVAAPVLLYQKSAGVPESHTEILSGAAAVGSMFAELFMIQSLLVFDPVPTPAEGQPGVHAYNRRAVSHSFLADTVKLLPEPLSICSWQISDAAKLFHCQGSPRVG